MASLSQFGAVVFAKDIERVARFYRELLPMVELHAARDHRVLEAAGCQLVVHAIPKAIAKSIRIDDPPQRRTETPIKLCFGVDSIARARAAAPALGGALNPAGREWEARGFRACDGHDPEGNVIQLREALA